MLIPATGRQGELKGRPRIRYSPPVTAAPRAPRRVAEPLSVYSTSGSATDNWNSPITIGRNPESNVHVSIARELKTVPRIISNQPLIVSVQGFTQALTTVGTPPIQRALTLATRVKRGEPVVAHRRMPNPLRTRQAFSRPVNALRVPFVSERISITVAPSPQMIGITAAGPTPAVIALEAISTS